MIIRVKAEEGRRPESSRAIGTEGAVVRFLHRSKI